MSDIISARHQLNQIARELKVTGRVDLASKIESIVKTKLHRRKAVRRAPVHSSSVTPLVRAEIVRLAHTTDMHASEIAAAVGVNPGRVSEILQGDR